VCDVLHNSFVAHAGWSASFRRAFTSTHGAVGCQGGCVGRHVARNRGASPISQIGERPLFPAEATRLPRERDDQIRIFRPKVVDAPPSARPPDRQESQRRYAVQDKQLQERYEAEREVLDRRHKAEIRTSGKRADVVRKRHEAEREALRTENQRRQRLLQQRRQPAQPQPQPAESDKPSRRSRDQRD
jgi:hypothetical protein